MATSRQFYVARICPWAHRPWIVLQELGLPFEHIEIDLKVKADSFVHLYQGGTVVGGGPGPAKVPVLVEHRPVAAGGYFALAESAVIAQYLLDEYGSADGAFLARPSAEAKARSAILVDHVGGRVIKHFYGLLMSQEAEAQATACTELLAALTDLSAAIAATGGPFIRGPAPSLADALLFPFPARFAALAHHRGFTVPETPELAAYHGWVAAMRARPAVAATLSPDALYIDGYGKR